MEPSWLMLPSLSYVFNPFGFYYHQCFGIIILKPQNFWSRSSLLFYLNMLCTLAFLHSPCDGWDPLKSTAWRYPRCWLNALWAGNEGITEVTPTAGGGLSTRDALCGIQWDFESAHRMHTQTLIPAGSHWWKPETKFRHFQDFVWALWAIKIWI